MLIDITRPIAAGALLHPGDPPLMHTRYADQGKGADYNLSLVTLGIHTGTHFDFPLHYDNAGRAGEAYGVERFVVTAHVVDCGVADAVQPAHLLGVPVQPGDAVLFKTRNAHASQERMEPGWVYITPEAAQACVDLQAGIVGMDYIEVEQGVDASSNPVHLTLLDNDVLLLENVDLRGVEAARYRLYCFPMLLPGLEGAPCRAVLETLD
jgi:arylformamidase